MSTYQIITAGAGSQFCELSNAMARADGPGFLEHDLVVAQYWPQLEALFPDNQFCLVESVSGQVVGIGHSIPLAFQGDWAELPDGGLDWVLAKGFQDQAAGRPPTLISALYIEVADGQRGKNISAQMLAAMRQIAYTQGFDHLIAPVRPSWKSRYPLISIDTYMHWQTADGLPFDPWVRVHVRAGGRILHPCRRAMTVRGTRQQWTSWTGLDFPDAGDYTVPHGLVPVAVREDVGEYVEPGIWVLHKTA